MSLADRERKRKRAAQAAARKRKKMRLLKLRHRTAPASPPPSGDYPAVVVSLGIEDVYDLTAAGVVGPQSTPIKVPGVDALPTGASYDTTNHRVILSGTYTTGVRKTFDGWDLTGVQAYLEITNKGWTVSNCKFGPSKVAGGALNDQNYPVKVSNTNASADAGDSASNIIIEYCDFNGFNASDHTYHGSAAFIGMGPSSAKINGIIFRRNKIQNMGQDNINGRGDDWDISYNWMINGGAQAGAHCDHSQFWDTNNIHVHHNYMDFTPLTVDQASFVGSISGTTLTVSSLTSGTIRIGQAVLGTGVTVNGTVATYITAGSGSTWTVSISQTVSSRSLTTKQGTTGRTHAVFLECFGDNTSHNDAVIEYNYIPGSSTLDMLGQLNNYVFGAALDAGTGSTGTSLSNNQFNFNAVQPGLAFMHPGTLAIAGAVSGTGNRKISDNSVIADFAS